MRGARVRVDTHKRLFGFAPRHPGDGRWQWEHYQLTSSRYGSVYRRRQPSHTEGDRTFGLLKSLQDVSVHMQFEDTGLRTVVRWKVGKNEE